jgi:hypothetical protein
MLSWFKRNRDPDAPPSEAELRDELLSAYLDNEVTADERRRAESLLATDPLARDALEGLRLVRSALADLGTVRAPRSFVIEATPPVPVALPLRRFELVARFGAVAAAAAFVFVVVGDLNSGGTPVTQPDSAASVESLAASAGDSAAEEGAAAATADETALRSAAAEDAATADDASAPAGDGESALDAPLPEGAGGGLEVDPIVTPEVPGYAAPTPTAKPPDDGRNGSEAARETTASPTPNPDQPTTDSTAVPPDAGGSDGAQPADDGGDGSGADAVPAGSPEAAPAAAATEAPGDLDAAAATDNAGDATLDDAGTAASDDALVPQAQSDAAPLPGTGEAATAGSSEDGSVSPLATILGAVTAALAAATALLWWRRRERADRPA